MALPTLRSPLARATVPILAGIAFFAALGGITWIMATFATDRAEVSVDAGNRTFVVGNVSDIAESIRENGPVLFPDLRDASGKRSIIIEHNGTDDAKGWQVYYAYPADKTVDCLVTQIEKTHTFTDCTGRTLNCRRRSMCDQLSRTKPPCSLIYAARQRRKFTASFF
jgi:hypothetical protein